MCVNFYNFIFFFKFFSVSIPRKRKLEKSGSKMLTFYNTELFHQIRAALVKHVIQEQKFRNNHHHHHHHAYFILSLQSENETMNPKVFVKNYET